MPQVMLITFYHFLQNRFTVSPWNEVKNAKYWILCQNVPSFNVFVGPGRTVIWWKCWHFNYRICLLQRIWNCLPLAYRQIMQIGYCTVENVSIDPALCKAACFEIATLRKLWKSRNLTWGCVNNDIFCCAALQDDLNSLPVLEGK